jgi:hypothetical protein
MSTVFTVKYEDCKYFGHRGSVGYILMDQLTLTRDTAEHSVRDNTPGWVLTILEMNEAINRL